MPTKEYLRKWRKKHPNYYLKYFRDNPDKRKNNNLLVRKWFKNNKEYYSQYYLKFPKKHKNQLARLIFNSFNRAKGISRQICEVAGCSQIGEGHHADYSKPLDVQWLYRKHHKEHHTKIKKERKKYVRQNKMASS